jgi:hypothetical protein
MFGGLLRTEPELVRSMHIKRPTDTLAALYRMAPLGWTSPAVAADHPSSRAGHRRRRRPRHRWSITIIATLMPQARLHTVAGGGHLALR